jgi:hypothetical protein
MKYKQNAVLTSLRRAQQFLDANAAVLGDANASARAELDSVVAQLTTLAVTQDGGARGARGETSLQHALRVKLRRKYMAPIAEVAKYKLPAVPELAALSLPPSNGSAQSDVAAAYGMADAASLHAQVFIASGLPATFVDDIRAAAAAVGESIGERSAYQGRRNGATSGLAAMEKQGRALLRVLNALVLAEVGDDAQLSREWVTARTVQRKPGPPAGSHPTAVTTPTLVSESGARPEAAPLAPGPVSPAVAVAA